MNEAKKLNPCPFCGGTASYTEPPRVGCGECGVSIKPKEAHSHDPGRDIAEAWNQLVSLVRPDTLREENRRLREELDLWRPLTPEEAEKALDEVEAAEPLSEERIAEIVNRATDPAERINNNEQAQLAADNRRLRDLLKRAMDENALRCSFHAQADDPWVCCCGKPKAYHWKPDARAALEGKPRE